MLSEKVWTRRREKGEKVEERGMEEKIGERKVCILKNPRKYLFDSWSEGAAELSRLAIWVHLLLRELKRKW